MSFRIYILNESLFAYHIPFNQSSIPVNKYSNCLIEQEASIIPAMAKNTFLNNWFLNIIDAFHQMFLRIGQLHTSKYNKSN